MVYLWGPPLLVQVTGTVENNMNNNWQKVQKKVGLDKLYLCAVILSSLSFAVWVSCWFVSGLDSRPQLFLSGLVFGLWHWWSTQCRSASLKWVPLVSITILALPWLPGWLCPVSHKTTQKKLTISWGWIFRANFFISTYQTLPRVCWYRVRGQTALKPLVAYSLLCISLQNIPTPPKTTLQKFVHVLCQNPRTTTTLFRA